MSSHGMAAGPLLLRLDGRQALGLVAGAVLGAVVGGLVATGLLAPTWGEAVPAGTAIVIAAAAAAGAGAVVTTQLVCWWRGGGPVLDARVSAALRSRVLPSDPDPAAWVQNLRLREQTMTSGLVGSAIVAVTTSIQAVLRLLAGAPTTVALVAVAFAAIMIVLVAVLVIRAARRLPIVRAWLGRMEAAVLRGEIAAGER